MKNKRLLITILLTVSTLSLTACGNTAASASAAGTENSQVVENTTTTESETAVIESVIPETTETVIESETTSEESDIDPNFNGAGYTGTLEETQQTYITYTDLDPTPMYVISATSTYHDLNVTDGELIVSGLVEPNQELLIDGKGTHNGTDYYRIVFQEEMMLNHQILIPAEFVASEPQQQEVDVQQQQQPEVQQPVEQQPEIPQWTPDTGVSQEDWNAFFGGGNTTGQHTWTPDGNDNMTIDENGNIWDPDIDEETAQKAGNQTVH